MEQRGLVPVAYLLLQEQGRVLLVRSLSNSIEGPLEIPSAYPEGGESPEFALIRMAKEELGLVFVAVDLDLVHVQVQTGGQGVQDSVAFFFAARRHERHIVLCRQMRGEVLWVLPDQLPECIPLSVVHAVACIDQGIAYSELSPVAGGAEVFAGEPAGA